MLRALDDFVIDRVAQPICDRLAGRTTPASLGQTFMLACGAFWSTSHVLAWQDGRLHAPGAVMGGLALGCIVHIAFRAGRTRESPGVMPEARMAWSGLRRMLLVWVPFSLGLSIGQAAAGTYLPRHAALDAALLLEIAGLYVLACRRTPPKPRRERAKQTAPVIVSARASSPVAHRPAGSGW